MLTLTPMPESEYADYFDFLVDLYTEQTAVAYGKQKADVEEYGRKIISGSLPQGFQTPDMYFLNIVSNESRIGRIWAAVQTEFQERVVFLRYIHLDPQHREQGLGKQAMQLFIAYVQENLKTSNIQLNVYGFNENAWDLYTKLGFTPLKATMKLKC